MKIINRLREYPPSRAVLDWVVAVCSVWFVGGVFVDGWAHNHLESSLESFFTPWHALFYSGFTALALAIGIAWLRNYRRGYRYSHALPTGYNAAAIGILIFFAGGVGDLIWHELFGIEANVDALLSPSHLLLAVGGALAVSAPLRSSFAGKRAAGNIVHELPAVLSLTTTMGLVIFMTQFMHPIVNPWTLLSKQTENPFFGHALGMGNFLVQMAILMGFLLYTVKRRRLPFGSFTIILVLSSLGLAAMKDTYYLVWAALDAGIIIDIISYFCFVAFTKPHMPRLWAAVVPAIFSTSLVLATLLKEPTWWSVHLLSGAVAVSAIVGWMMSYLVFTKDS